MPQTKIITIKRDGTVKHIYDDKLQGIAEQGKSTIARASHVEPWGELSMNAVEWLYKNRPIFMDKHAKDTCGGWWSDLLVSGGPVLGPFPTRAEALQAEVDWINANILTEAKK